MESRGLVLLSSLYLEVYKLLEQCDPKIEFDGMIEMSLNGMYLAKVMEMEIERLYNGKIEIDREFLKFLINERRPQFFKKIYSNCVRRGEQAKEVLVI
jgi:hypothetical protein